MGKLELMLGWAQPWQGRREGPWPWWGLSCRLSLLSPSPDHLDPVALQAAPGTLFCCSSGADHQGNARQFSAAPGCVWSPLSACSLRPKLLRTADVWPQGQASFLLSSSPGSPAGSGVL